MNKFHRYTITPTKFEIILEIGACRYDAALQPPRTTMEDLSVKEDIGPGQRGIA